MTQAEQSESKQGIGDSKTRTNPYTRLLFTAALTLTVTCYLAENACADYSKDWTGPDGIKHVTYFNDDGTVEEDVWTDKDGNEHFKLFDEGTVTQEQIYFGNPVWQWTQCFYENSRLSSCTTYDNLGNVLGRVTYTYSDDGRTETGTVTDGNGNFEFQMTTTKDANGQIVTIKETDNDGSGGVAQFDSNGIWALTVTGPGGAVKRSDARVDQDVVNNQGVGQGRPKLPGVPNQPGGSSGPMANVAGPPPVPPGLHPGTKWRQNLTRGNTDSAGTQNAGAATGATAGVAGPDAGSPSGASAGVAGPSTGTATATGGTAGVAGSSSTSDGSSVGETHGSGGQAGAGNKKKIIWQKPSSSATDALNGGNSATGGTAGVAGSASDQGGRDVPQREPTPNKKKKIIRQRSSSAVTNTLTGGTSTTGGAAGVAAPSGSSISRRKSTGSQLAPTPSPRKKKDSSDQP